MFSIHKFLLVLAILILPVAVFAQVQQDSATQAKFHKIVKYDGTVFVGKILSMDAREVLLETKNVGQIIIPKHEIKEIKEIKEVEISASGEYIPAEVFSTRYFITTNGLPIEKGESYILWSLYGPDFQFSVGKNISLGIMTSWIGMPVIGTAKYCIPLGKDVNLAFGTLLGTGSWAKPDFGIALPYGSLTFGDRRKNITFSGGYGAVFYKESTSDPKPPYNPIKTQVLEGRVLLSVAGMAKVGKKISVVFDSFIVTAGKNKPVTESQFDPNTGVSNAVTVMKRQPGFALLLPGLRWQMESNKAFQFGFAGIGYDTEVLPVPIPMIQWFRKL